MPTGGGDILGYLAQSNIHTMKTKMHFAMIKNSAHDNAQHQCDLINMNAKYYKAVVKKGFQNNFKI